MLSIDLSRAFDMVPRWALSASLLSAEVPRELHDLILDIHQHCQYTGNQCAKLPHAAWHQTGVLFSTPIVCYLHGVAV